MDFALFFHYYSRHINIHIMEFIAFILSTSNLLQALRLTFDVKQHSIVTLFTKNKITAFIINPLKPELNSICYLLALLAHHFLHVSRIRVKSLTFRGLMSYIYMEHPFLMFLDHTRRRSTVGRTPLDE